MQVIMEIITKLYNQMKHLCIHLMRKEVSNTKSNLMK